LEGKKYKESYIDFRFFVKLLLNLVSVSRDRGYARLQRWRVERFLAASSGVTGLFRS